MATKIKVEIDVDKRLSEMEHFVCCHDVTKTHCGLTVPVEPQQWVETVECPACMAIDALDSTETFCPVEGLCSHALNKCSCPPDED